NVIDYTERTARHVMIPRADIAYVSLARPLEENLGVIDQTAHTRFPLASSDIDHVVGMVHVKDLFRRRSELRSSEDLAALKRPILFVPESRPLDALQRDFQDGRTHMAIVVDEYGGTSGLVTAYIGRIPRRGDKVALPGYELRVVEMKGRRVGKVLAVTVPEAQADAAAGRDH